MIKFGDRAVRNPVFSAKVPVITKFAAHVGALVLGAPTDPKLPDDNPPGRRESGQPGLGD